MSWRNRLMLTPLLLIVVLAMNGSSAAQDSNDHIKQLLEEVRLLRLALERNNLISYRTQILIERTRAQQSTVDRLRAQIDDVQEQIRQSSAEALFPAEFLSQLEERVAEGTESEMQYKMMNAQVELMRKREEQLKEKELQLTSRLIIELAKLEELQQRLDLMEQSLQ